MLFEMGEGERWRYDRMLALFLVSVLIGAVAVPLLSQMSSPSPPDVVLITVGAANRAHFSCYGYPRNTTPHICALAEDGVRYTNAFTPATEDAVVLPAIHTGKQPYNLGVFDIEIEDIPSDNFTSIAEELGSAYDKRLYVFGAAYGHGVFTSFHLPWKLEDAFDTSELIGPEEREQVMRTVGRRMEETAVYTSIQVMDVHSVVGGVSDNDRFYRGSGYDGRLKYVDDYIGRLLNEMRRRGVYEDAMIIVTGNYGERLGPGEGHAILYPATVQVPLLIKPPGNTDPRTQDSLASIQDLKPTILNTVTDSDGERPGRNMLRHGYAVEYVPMFIASEIIGTPQKVWMGVANRDALLTLTANGTTRHILNATVSEERVGWLLERLAELRDHIWSRTDEGAAVSSVLRTQLIQIQAVDLTNYSAVASQPP